MNIGLVGPTIAGVNADAFPEELLDGRDEGASLREGQITKGDVRRQEAACQRRRIVRFRGRDLLRGELPSPIVVGPGRLRDAVGGQRSIRPCGSAIPVKLSPVAVPCWRSVVASGSAFVLAAEIELPWSGGGA